MSIQLIKERCKKFAPKTQLEEENVLREIAQEIALSALARTDFFKHAAFVGGSCLRILHGLNRFSEDLDFWTLQPSPQFAWKPYLEAIKAECTAFGLNMEIIDREQVESKILIVSDMRENNKKLQIKLEIDTNPPQGAHFEAGDINFPYPCSLTVLERSCLFASKVAALFDRDKEKGRHWYDFIWYVNNKWAINLPLLGNCLSRPEITKRMLQNELITLALAIDWQAMRKDVLSFIPPSDHPTLKAWSPEFFKQYIEVLN